MGSYACRSGPGLDGCGGIRIQAPGVEAHVRDLVCGMLADPATRAALAAFVSAGDHPAGEPPVERVRAMEAKRERLIDLYTDGDIDKGEFRSRRDDLDEQARAIEADLAQRTGTAVLASVPATFEALVEAWEAGGVGLQRRLTELLHPITVKPAGARRRLFDPDRLVIVPRA